MADRHPLVRELEQALGDLPPSAAPVIEKINAALMNPGLPELWGVTEVAAYLGIDTYQNLYKLRDLPEPAMILNRGRLWNADVIRAYGEQRRRRKAKEDEA